MNYLLEYLAIHIIIITVLIILNLKRITGQFKSIRKKTWAILLLILIFGFYLRLSSGITFQPSHEIEWEYSSFAKHIVEEGQVPLFVHPYGYTFLLSIIFRLFEANILSVFFFNLIIGSLSIILMFLFCYSLFRRNSIALVSAFMLAILPKHIYFSRVGASENLWVFFALLTLTSLVLSIKINNLKIYFLTFSLFAYLGEIKTESLALIVIFVIYFFLNRKKVSFSKILIASSLLILLCLPVSYWYVKHEDFQFIINKTIGFEIFKFAQDSQYPSLNNQWSLLENSGAFVITLLKTKYHSIIFLIAFIVSFIKLKKYIKKFILLVSFIAITTTIYSVSLFPNAERYFVMLYIGMVPLAGLGINVLINTISGLNLHKHRKMIGIIFILLLLLSTFSLKELFNPREKFYNSQYTDINDIIRAEKKLDKNATIICCGWMKHCEFILPHREVKTIGQDPIVLSKDRDAFYIRSIHEQKSGCDPKRLNWFNMIFNMSYPQKLNIYTHLRIFKIEQ